MGGTLILVGGAIFCQPLCGELLFAATGSAGRSADRIDSTTSPDASEPETASRSSTTALIEKNGLTPSEKPDTSKSVDPKRSDKDPPGQDFPLPMDEPAKTIVSGRVVLLTDALKRRKIKHYAEEIKGQVVLETRQGELLPIIPDWRGRALFQDSRLRDRPVDLLVSRRKNFSHLQVLSIYTFDEKGARQLTDYWCDICSIPMYEIKECECCQGPIRLRFQPKELPTDLNPDASKQDRKQ